MSSMERTIVIAVIGIIVLSAQAILSIMVYRALYFRSKEFLSIKNNVKDLTSEFNELNIYADSLSANILGGQTRQTFVGEITNTSLWNYKHPGLFSRQNHGQIYHCSRSVVSNAQLDGFRYLCKYFDIAIAEESRNAANEMLNNFESYLESRELLQRKRNALFSKIERRLPLFIRMFKPSLYKKLGLTGLDLDSVIYPEYIFSYTSPGGNSGLQYTLELSVSELERFIDWLDEKIKYKKSAHYQRIIMTPELRESIKARDKYTCKQCGVNTVKEPTLLLEIDHIIPVSKGGMSVEKNLQCLCWKCNRSKGARIVQASR